MRFRQTLAGTLGGLAVAAAIAAVPDIGPAPAAGAVQPATGTRVAAAAAPTRAAPGAAESAGSAAASAGSAAARTRQAPRADAARTPAQRAVARAVRASALVADVPGTAYSVQSIRITAHQRWASALLVPTDAAALDPVVVLLRRPGQAWRVEQLGSFEVGCGLAPAQTLRELGLDCS